MTKMVLILLLEGWLFPFVCCILFAVPATQTYFSIALFDWLPVRSKDTRDLSQAFLTLVSAAPPSYGGRSLLLPCGVSTKHDDSQGRQRQKRSF